MVRAALDLVMIEFSIGGEGVEEGVLFSFLPEGPKETIASLRVLLAFFDF